MALGVSLSFCTTTTTSVFFGGGNLQRPMANVAVGYQNKLNKAKGSTQGRDLMLVADEEPRTSVIDLTQHIFPRLIFRPLKAVKVSCRGIFLFGYDAHPAITFAGMTPNSAAMAKCLFMDEVNVLMTQLSTLVSAASEELGPPIENLDDIDSICFLEEAKLKVSRELCRRARGDPQVR